MNEKIKILREKLGAAKSVAIIGHKNPDGDAVGSALALKRLIEINYHIRATVIYDGNIPGMLDAVPWRHTMVHHSHVPMPAMFDVVILVDYGTVRHLEFAASIIRDAKYRIEIDHHRNDAPIADLCIDDDRADATAVIIYEIMRACRWRVNDDILNLLALAIITDTGNFKFVRDGRSLRIMADMVSSGVSIGEITDMLANQPRRAVLVEARAAANAEFFYRNRLAVATIPNRDYKHMDGRGENVLSILRQIHGVEYIALLKEQKENQIGISLRGRNRPVDHIAAMLGGGGHAYAAGAVVADTLENVRARIIELFGGEK